MTLKDKILKQICALSAPLIYLLIIMLRMGGENIWQIHPPIQGNILAQGDTWLIEAYKPLPDPLPKEVSFTSLLILSERKTAFFDFDQGAYGKSENSDLEFQMTFGTQMFLALRPLNGSKYFPIGKTSPDFDDCQEHLSQFIRFSGAELVSEQHYFCLMTNEGRLSSIFVDSIDEFDVKTLENKIHIYFKTWDEIVAYKSR